MQLFYILILLLMSYPYKYAITDKHGNIIEEYKTLKEARQEKKDFQKQDKLQGISQVYKLVMLAYNDMYDTVSIV